MVRGSKVSVIGFDYYCSSQMVELVVPKPERTVLVRNINNDDIIFTIEDTSSFYGWGRKKRVVLDSAGTTILTLRHKIRSLPFRWRVYKGSSKDKNDLIFTAKQSKMFGSDIELKVFLASNKSEKTCDFKVGTSSGVIYTRDSHSNIIAQMRDDDRVLKVYPGVDQAFIISLIVIQDGINQQRSSLSKAALKSITLLIAILFEIIQQRSGAGAGANHHGMGDQVMLLVLIIKILYMWLKNSYDDDDASQHGMGADHDHKGDGHVPHGMGAHHALPIREKDADDHHGMGDYMHHLMTFAPLIIKGLSLLMK